MCALCGKLPRLWISTTLLFNCQNFLVECSDMRLSQLSDLTRDSLRRVWANGLQLKTAVGGGKSACVRWDSTDLESWTSCESWVGVELQ